MPKLTDAELATLRARYHLPWAPLSPCRAARLFSSILDRTVTCLDAQDALAHLRLTAKATTHADQRLRDPALRPPR